MSDHGDRDELIDHIYAVAIEPERFGELIDIWDKHLNKVGEQVNYNFSEELKLVNRHLDRASTILSMVEESEQHLPQPMLEKLNSEAQAMIALAEDGSINAANNAARALFGIEDGADLDNLPLHPDGLKKIRTISSDLFDREASRPTLPPNLCRIETINSDAPLLVTLSLWETAGNRRFVLMKSADVTWPAHLSPLVKRAFDLTEAEVDVMKLLVEGNKLESVAGLRGSSMSTVRTQVRSIYAKTSTHNQSELLRMAIGLTTLELAGKNTLTGAYQSPPDASAVCFPLADHRRILSLPDGRQLDYAIFGPEDGIPCLHFHNEFYGDIWPAKLAELAMKNRLRVIAPARAYYGRTSPYPDGVLSFEQTSIDIEHLLENLGVDRVVAVAQVWGMRFALKFANRRPDIVAAIVGAAPSLPFSPSDDRRKMPKISRFVANIVRHQSHMLEFAAKSGYALHSRTGSKKFLEALLSQSEPDLRVIQDPDNLAAIVEGFKFSSAHEHKAYFYDYHQTLPNDRQMLIGQPCKTYAVIGTEDNNSRHERAEKLIEEGANLEIIRADSGGEMLFYSHPELIVSAIKRAWNA